jgi:hypothetical protein
LDKKITESTEPAELGGPETNHFRQKRFGSGGKVHALILAQNGQGALALHRLKSIQSLKFLATQAYLE